MITTDKIKQEIRDNFDLKSLEILDSLMRGENNPEFHEVFRSFLEQYLSRLNMLDKATSVSFLYAVTEIVMLAHCTLSAELGEEQTKSLLEVVIGGARLKGEALYKSDKDRIHEAYDAAIADCDCDKNH